MPLIRPLAANGVNGLDAALRLAHGSQQFLRTGRQQAAMVWGRGANAFFSTPRVSKAGDAYELASAFSDDFAKLVNKGESPFEGVNIDIPSWDKIGSNMGLAPKYAACEAYGRSPGVVGMVAGKLGLPPDWTDDGPRAARKPQ